MIDMGMGQKKTGDFRRPEREGAPILSAFALLHAAVDEELHAIGGQKVTGACHLSRRP